MLLSCLNILMLFALEFFPILTRLNQHGYSRNVGLSRYKATLEVMKQIVRTLTKNDFN